MEIVLDASFAAAWVLPEPDSAAAEAVIRQLTGLSQVPSLFWHEARNCLILAERHGRIAEGEALINLGRLRRLPIDDAGGGSDTRIVALALTHGLTAYDAAYLALAAERYLPLATLDRPLAEAAKREMIFVLGPLGTP
ncbi:MAG TPA: type II toxin-antitoxin system VapC family toxin [Methylocella sp.]|nr:type II toxin-antitoxin system VapC family toxin [Methylocella sp.]